MKAIIALPDILKKLRGTELGQVPMTVTVVLDLDAEIRKCGHFFRVEIRSSTEVGRRDEHRCRPSPFCQLGVGILEIVRPTVIEGNCQRRSFESLATAHQVHGSR